MKKFISNFQSLVALASVYLVSCLIFVFVAVNATQLLFGMRILGANALEPFEYNFVIDNLVEDFKQFDIKELDLTGEQYVRPELIKISRNSISIPIDKQYLIDQRRWIRPTTAHFMHLNFDLQGIPGDTLVYMKQSWQTIPDTSVLTKGTVISIESVNGGAIDYTVMETYTLNGVERYVPEGSNERQLILLIIHKNGSYTISRAVSDTPKSNNQSL